MTTEQTRTLFEDDYIKRMEITRTQIFIIDLCKICGSFASPNKTCQHRKLKQAQTATSAGAAAAGLLADLYRRETKDFVFFSARRVASADDLPHQDHIGGTPS